MKETVKEMNNLVDEMMKLTVGTLFDAKSMSMMDEDTMQMMALCGKAIVLSKRMLVEFGEACDKIDEINSKLDILLLTKK